MFKRVYILATHFILMSHLIRICLSLLFNHPPSPPLTFSIFFSSFIFCWFCLWFFFGSHTHTHIHIQRTCIRINFEQTEFIFGWTKQISDGTFLGICGMCMCEFMQCSLSMKKRFGHFKSNLCGSISSFTLALTPHLLYPSAFFHFTFVLFRWRFFLRRSSSTHCDLPILRHFGVEWGYLWPPPLSPSPAAVVASSGGISSTLHSEINNLGTKTSLNQTPLNLNLNTDTVFWMFIFKFVLPEWRSEERRSSSQYSGTQVYLSYFTWL